MAVVVEVEDIHLDLEDLKHIPAKEEASHILVMEDLEDILEDLIHIIHKLELEVGLILGDTMEDISLVVDINLVGIKLVDSLELVVHGLVGMLEVVDSLEGHLVVVYFNHSLVDKQPLFQILHRHILSPQQL